MFTLDDSIGLGVIRGGERRSDPALLHDFRHQLIRELCAVVAGYLSWRAKVL
jgi:hypothetical protein